MIELNFHDSDNKQHNVYLELSFSTADWSSFIYQINFNVKRRNAQYIVDEKDGEWWQAGRVKQVSTWEQHQQAQTTDTAHQQASMFRSSHT